MIWESFLCGDDEAYTYIYRQYSQALYAYGMHFTSDKGLVEDCIQDVFIKYFRIVNTFSLRTILSYIFL